MLGHGSRIRVCFVRYYHGYDMVDSVHSKQKHTNPTSWMMTGRYVVRLASAEIYTPTPATVCRIVRNASRLTPGEKFTWPALFVYRRYRVTGTTSVSRTVFESRPLAARVKMAELEICSSLQCMQRSRHDGLESCHRRRSPALEAGASSHRHRVWPVWR
jgi:hypothetical protein